jgi:polynucleotide 5'-kinase involved in rRNA processing
MKSERTVVGRLERTKNSTFRYRILNTVQVISPQGELDELISGVESMHHAPAARDCVALIS